MSRNDCDWNTVRSVMITVLSHAWFFLFQDKDCCKCIEIQYICEQKTSVTIKITSEQIYKRSLSARVVYCVIYTCCAHRTIFRLGHRTYTYSDCMRRILCYQKRYVSCHCICNTITTHTIAGVTCRYRQTSWRLIAKTRWKLL